MQESAQKGNEQSAQLTVREAIRLTEGIRGQYLEAAKNLAEVGTGTSAALIGLSTLGLLKAVTSPNASDLAAIGVVGSGVYAYGSIMSSRPRERIYLAGASALGCALRASAPYDLPAGWLRPGPNQVGDKTALSVLSANAQAARRNLDDVAAKLRAEQAVSTVVRSAGSRAPQSCEGAVFSSCANLGPAASPEDKRRHAAICGENRALRDRLCTPQGGTTSTVSAHPDVALTLARIKELIQHLQRLSKQAHRVLANADMAGDRLWDKAADVQIAVAREVTKTEPDPAAVLATVQGMRDVALRLTPQAPKTTSEGKAENEPAKRSGTPRMRERPNDLLNQAEIAIANGGQTADALSAKLAEMRMRLKNARVKLDQCVLDPSGTSDVANTEDDDDDADATTTAGKGNSAPSSVLVADTSQLKSPTLAASLGLPEGATTEQVISRVAQCQRQKLGMSNADGRTMDQLTLTVIVSGQCKGLS